MVGVVPIVGPDAALNHAVRSISFRRERLIHIYAGPAATGCAFHKVHNNSRVREQFKARFGSTVCGCYKRSMGDNAFDISGLSAAKNLVAWKRAVQLRQEGDLAGVRDHP
jgi:hypothetical protein